MNQTTLSERIESIKQRVNLQTIAAQTLGEGKRSGKAVMYFSPFREDGDNASFAVYEDGFKDFGGSGDSGDQIEFVQRLLGLNFFEALDYLDGKRDDTYTIRQAANRHEPPARDWQEAMQAFVEQAHQRLLNTPAALRYLQEERGLPLAIIQRHKLGYNPDWMETGYRDEQGRVKAAPGIVIPWMTNNVLYAVRIRTHQGALAEMMGQPQATDLPKYMSIRGSRQSSGLFVSGVLTTSKVIVVEGEFDAMLLHAETSQTVITRGSAGDHNHIAPKWLNYMMTLVVIYTLLDADGAGQKATAALKQQLDNVVALTLPTGKDVTEFKQQGGDLKQLIQQQTSEQAHPEPAAPATSGNVALQLQPKTQAQLWFEQDTLPLWWLSALMMIDTNIAPVVLALHRAFYYGNLDPHAFTVDGIMNLTGLTRHLVDKTLVLMDGYLLEKIPPDSATYLLGVKDGKNRQVGRPQHYYHILPADGVTARMMTDLLERRVRENIYSKHLSGVSDNMMRDMGISRYQADLWGKIVQDIQKSDPETYKQLDYEFNREMTGDNRSWKGWFHHLLNDMTVLPLPLDIRSDADLRVAMTRAYIEANGGQTQLPNHVWQRMLGCTKKTVKLTFKKAGVQTEAQFQTYTIDLPQDEKALKEAVKQAQRQGKGRVVELTVHLPDNTFVISGFMGDIPDVLDFYRCEGAKLTLKVQQANLQNLIEDDVEDGIQEEIEAGEDSPETPEKAPVVQRDRKAGKTAQKGRIQPKKSQSDKLVELALNGHRHRPDWLRQQLVMALHARTLYMVDEQGALRLPAGELVMAQPTLRDLLDALLQNQPR